MGAGASSPPLFVAPAQKPVTRFCDIAQVLDACIDPKRAPQHLSSRLKQLACSIGPLQRVYPARSCSSRSRLPGVSFRSSPPFLCCQAHF
jgi:hypothetical protein